MLNRLDVFALPMCRKQEIYYVRFADYLAIDIARSNDKAGDHKQTRYKPTNIPDRAAAKSKSHRDSGTSLGPYDYHQNTDEDA